MNSPDCCLQCPKKGTELWAAVGEFGTAQPTLTRAQAYSIRHEYFAIQPGFHLQFHASRALTIRTCMLCTAFVMLPVHLLLGSYS